MQLIEKTFQEQINKQKLLAFVFPQGHQQYSFEAKSLCARYLQFVQAADRNINLRNCKLPYQAPGKHLILKCTFPGILLFVVTFPKAFTSIILLQSPQGGICLDQFHNALFISEFNQISPPPISPGQTSPNPPSPLSPSYR